MSSSSEPSLPEHQVSRILQRVSAGDPAACADLLPLLYEELRRLAAARMRHEAIDHTLQPTALVHEAYLRLMRQPDSSWENRRHFFVAAAEAMRRILIEHARARDALKRGRGQGRLPLTDLPAVSSENDPLEILAVVFG